LGLVAFFWSLTAWFFHTLLGAGPAAVGTISRWFQIDPLQLVWLADTLGAVGGIAQVFVWIIWAIGMGALGLIAWLSTRAAREARDAMVDIRVAAGDPAAGRVPAVEGAVTQRTVEPAPTPVSPPPSV
jgi:hypothetical protein